LRKKPGLKVITGIKSRLCREFDSDSEKISRHLVVGTEWSPEHFAQMQKVLEDHNSKIDPHAGDLEGLKDFLVDKREFLLRLLENPNLLEHERFTELL